MNQALRVARGEFVQFLNAGDALFDRDVLEDVSRSIQRNPEVEIFYGDVRKVQSRSGYEIYPSQLSRMFLFMSTVCHQAWFVRHETYLRYGGFDTLRPAGADPKLLLRMVVGCHAKHAHIPRVLVVYKGGGVSTTPDWKSEGLATHDEVRRELYRPAEYLVFKLFQACRSWLKIVIYDTIGWRLWRFIQLRRANRRY